MDRIKQHFQAIIFDMDGTIVDTEKKFLPATIDLLDSYGITDLTAEQHSFIISLAGKDLRSIAHGIQHFFNINDTMDNIIQRKFLCMNHIFEQGIDFIQGFEQFHGKLSAFQIPTGIATNATPTHLQRINTVMRLDSFFGKNMYCIADVNNKPKPSPALFLYTAQKLGVEPSQCLVFEDSRYGFEAAKAAGMKCIAIKSLVNEHILHHVDAAISGYHEAEDALHGLIQGL